MSIKNYFLEIKNRLFLVILIWLSIILVCYVFKETLLVSFVKQTGSLKFCFQKLFYFIFTDVSEIFYAYMALIFFVCNQVTFWYIFYHILIFILPGLYDHEYLYLVFVFKITLVSFVFSIFIFNTNFFPFAWDFFLNFQNLEILNVTTFYFESKISEYLIFYISFYYIFVFYFQSLVMLFLVFDFLETKGLTVIQVFRKFFYYFFVVFSTAITPPDIFSQLSLSVCFVFSYEILVFYFICQKIRKQYFNSATS